VFNLLDRLQIVDPDHRYYRNYCCVLRLSGQQARVQLEGREVAEFWIDTDQAVRVQDLPQPLLDFNLAAAAFRPRRRRIFPMIALFADNDSLSSYGYFDIGPFTDSESVDFTIENTGSAALYLAYWNIVS
jgi:hypothetical protein